VFFQEEYIPARPAERRRLLNPYFEKIFTYSLDVNLRCQFGALKPGIDWEEVEEERQTILLDFRDETDPEMRRFKLLWVFFSLFEFIKRRGRREWPLAVTIDEFSAMAYKATDGTNPLAVMLDEFIQQYLRGQNIWLTVSHQSIAQIDEQLRNSLFSLGTYMFGRTGTRDEARILADALFKRDPMRVKHWRRVWGREENMLIPRNEAKRQYFYELFPTYPYYVLSHEPEFMSLEDQLEEAANQIHELNLFGFLCRPALGEGGEGMVSQAVVPITIANLDRDAETSEYQFPNYERVARLRSALESQAGIPAATLLKELDATFPVQATHQPHRQLRPRQDGNAQHPAITDATVNGRPRTPRHQRREQLS
jgi:hypothetical protein